MKELTPEEWLEWERRKGLRDRDGQILDDPDQQGFGFGESLNLPGQKKRKRDPKQPDLF